jgi:hypothetical protein
MARRASSSVHPAWLAASFLLLAAAVIGGYFLYSQISDPYRTLTPLDVPAYLENANSLRGNVYKISATVDTQLAWSPTLGRLYSVQTENGAEVLPVLIPAQFNALNMQKGQRYFFKIEVGEKGVLRVQDVRKV